MTTYIKDGFMYNGGSIVLDDRRIFNPSDEQLISAGFSPVTVTQHPRTVEEARSEKLADIKTYDVSENVNSFTFNGYKMWLPYELREKIRSRLDTEKKNKRTLTTLWYESVPFTMPVDTAENLLDIVELYAIDCCDITAQHKANVESLQTIEEIDAYDFTTGYPEHPNINS